jgi:hypothetical protein
MLKRAGSRALPKMAKQSSPIKHLNNIHIFERTVNSHMVPACSTGGIDNKEQITALYAKLYKKYAVKSSSFSGNDGDIIAITTIMNSYNITSHELFYHLYHNMYNANCLRGDKSTIRHPFCKFMHENMTLWKAQNVLRRYRDDEIDYYNGVPIKTRFRQNETEKQFLNHWNIDARSHFGMTAQVIIGAMNSNTYEVAIKGKEN